MLGSDQGRVVGGVAPHTPVEIDLSPITSAISRVSERKERSSAAANSRYNKLLMQEHKGRWASEMSKQHDDLISEYADLYSRQGIQDPLNDPRALEYQRKVAEFQTKRSQAAYLDKHLDDAAKLVATNPDGTFDDESVAEAMAPVDMGFDDLLDAKVASPQKKAPMADLAKTMDIYSKGVFARKGNVATMSEIATDAKDFVAAAPPDVINSLKVYYDKLTPEEKTDLMRQAAANQLPDPMGQGALTMAVAKMVDNDRTVFDFEKFQGDIVSSIDPKKFSNDQYSSFTSKSQVQDALEQKGMSLINADPRILMDKSVRSAMQMPEGLSEKDERKIARAYFRGLHPLVKNQDLTKRAPRAEGGGTKSDKAEASEEKWYEMFSSGNAQDSNSALAFTSAKGDPALLLPDGSLGPDEKAIRVESTGYGVIVKIQDEVSGKSRNLSIPIADINPEKAKNYYRSAEKGVGRGFLTTESGKPAAPKTATNPKKEDW